jgi:hypothetical protein
MDISTLVGHRFGNYRSSEGSLLILHKSKNVVFPELPWLHFTDEWEPVCPSSEAFTLEVKHVVDEEAQFVCDKEGYLKVENKMYSKRKGIHPVAAFKIAEDVLYFVAQNTRLSEKVLEMEGLPAPPEPVVQHWESDSSDNFDAGRLDEGWVFDHEGRYDPEARRWERKIGRGSWTPTSTNRDLPIVVQMNGGVWDEDHESFSNLLETLVDPLTLKLPFSKWTLINDQGINNDSRGSHPIDWAFAFQSEITIQREDGHPLTLGDIAQRFPWIRSHKLDRWYEMFSGIQNIEIDGDEIRVHVAMDHGS